MAEEEKNECPRCRRKVNPYWAYCPMCGQPLRPLTSRGRGGES